MHFSFTIDDPKTLFNIKKQEDLFDAIFACTGRTYIHFSKAAMYDQSEVLLRIAESINALDSLMLFDEYQDKTYHFEFQFENRIFFKGTSENIKVIDRESDNSIVDVLTKSAIEKTLIEIENFIKENICPFSRLVGDALLSRKPL